MAFIETDLVVGSRAPDCGAPTDEFLIGFTPRDIEEQLPPNWGADCVQLGAADQLRTAEEIGEDLRSEVESERVGMAQPSASLALQESQRDAPKRENPRLSRSRRVAAIAALSAGVVVPVAACGSSLTHAQTRQETGTIRTVAQDIAAQAIRLSGGQNPIFTVTQLGPGVAELTAASPAYTRGPNGRYPLNGDPYDVTIENPTPAENRIIAEVVTGFQGRVIVDIAESIPGELQLSDATGVLSVDIETQDEGQDFPNNNPVTTDVSIDSPQKILPDLGSSLPDWQISYSRVSSDGSERIYAATDLDNTGGYQYWPGQGPVGTTKILDQQTRAAFTELSPHLNTYQQTVKIINQHQLFLP